MCSITFGEPVELLLSPSQQHCNCFSCKLATLEIFAGGEEAIKTLRFPSAKHLCIIQHMLILIRLILDLQRRLDQGRKHGRFVEPLSMLPLKSF